MILVIPAFGEDVGLTAIVAAIAATCGAVVAVTLLGERPVPADATDAPPDLPRVAAVSVTRR